MLKLKVVTPNREVLNIECLSLIVPGKYGEMQILPGHAPILAEPGLGIIIYDDENKKISRLMITAGFIQVENNNINILCEDASLSKEVDKSKEQDLQKEILNKIAVLKEKDSKDFELMQAKLDESVARLRLID